MFIFQPPPQKKIYKKSNLRKIEGRFIYFAPKYCGCKTIFTIVLALKKFMISYLIKETGKLSIHCGKSNRKDKILRLVQLSILTVYQRIIACDTIHNQ